jgi:hypothetical protein
MYQGEIATANPVNMIAESVSAPKSADFYNLWEIKASDCDPNRYSFHMLDKPRQEFPRDDFGSVDVSAYHPYIIDPLEATPIYLNKKLREIWQPQHVLFQSRFYRQEGISKHIKDPVLRAICITPYMQIIMRRKQELLVHRDFMGHVVAPPPETQRRQMIDFELFDKLGAAALGRRMSLVPEAIENFISGHEVANGDPDLSPLERAECFDAVIGATLKELEKPLVTSQTHITGVVARLSQMTNNEQLRDETAKRIEKFGEAIPFALKSPTFYYGLGNTMLKGAENVRPIKTEALQTEVDEVQLAA